MTGATCGAGPMMIAVSFISEWRKVYLAMAIFTAVIIIPFLLIPESPRANINQGKTDEAEKTLRRLAKWNGVTWSGFRDDVESKDTAVLGLWSQLTTMVSNKVFLLESLGSMTLWCVVFLCYCGLYYAWDKIIPDTTVGYPLGMGLQVIGYALFLPVVRVFGRRMFLMGSFLLAAVTFALAAATNTITLGSNGDWTVASIASIFAQFLLSWIFPGVLTWNVELAPCTHAGTVFGLANGSSKIFAMFAPSLFNSLVMVTGGFAASFGILSGLCVVGLCVSYLQVETMGETIVKSPEEVAERRSRRNRVTVFRNRVSHVKDYEVNEH